MGFYRSLYLAYDNACQYLKEAGVSPYEIYRLKIQMVNGAHRSPLVIYRFDDLETLARKHSPNGALPSVEKFVTKYQKSRHLSKTARSKDRCARTSNFIQQYLNARVTKEQALEFYRTEMLEDGDRDIV